ncbi:MAG: RNA-guided pseudouridylation complex pseudouridine synthase subunit Cbf5 [Candidatus Aenigmatarchaeota archaeon]
MTNSILKKGVVLVDKPRGMTSFDVVEKVCEKLKVSKGGHTGTLDPNVTGLMIIALEEARKAMIVLMGMEKSYEGEMILHKDVELSKLENAFKKFTGEIIQKPPVKSRVARIERKRKVYELRVIEKNERKIKFFVRCEAGTYIRKLVHDIGQYLGCGAHMSELRRTKIGPFDVSEAKKLSEISEKDVVTLEKILERIKLKKVIIRDEDVKKVRNGVPIPVKNLTEKSEINLNEIVGIYDKNQNIIALGKNVGEKIKIERVFLA